jgi:hypothetical protein
MKDIHPAVQNQLYQRKLKYLRDYEQNCKELEEELQWMAKWFPLMWTCLCVIVITGIYLLVKYGPFLDSVKP